MKAITIRQQGDQGFLQYEEVPDPNVGPSDVLIKVRAASVNRGDLSLGYAAGSGGPSAGAPIIGWDVAGDIAETGSDATKLKVGQRVVARLVSGGYAELAAAPEDTVVPLPDDLDYDEGASVPVAFLTAWVALFDTAKLTEGETALVQAAGSGVGIAGIQIARRVAGARVFTTAGTDDKVAMAAKLGADVAINYETHDFLAEVLDLTQGEGVHVVLDGVGGEVFARSQMALAEGGRLVSVGRSSGDTPVVDTELAKRKSQTVVTGWRLRDERTHDQAAVDLERIIGLIAERTLKTVVDRVFPLSEAAEAHRYLASRAQFGKVVLRP